MRWIWVLMVCLGLQGEPLTPALEKWRQEIEKEGVRVLVGRVRHDSATNSYSLDESSPRPEMFAQYLRQTDFLIQFSQMYGAMVHHKGQDEAYLVFLNMARAKEWEGHEEAIMAHELGHAWIKSRKYPTPVFQPGLAGCLAIHTGDIAQHVLIRREMDSRGIDHRTFWMKTLEQAAERAEQMSPPGREDRCLWVRQAAELTDVRLGLGGVEWKGRERYESVVKRVFPEVGPTVEQIVVWMKEHEMEDRDEHREALKVVFEALKALAYERSKPYIL